VCSETVVISVSYYRLCTVSVHLLQDSASWRDAVYATDFQSKVCLILLNLLNNICMSGTFW